MSEATIDPVYVCPEGNVYRDGDIAPVIKTETGFKYNVPIKRYDCPGFPGLVKIAMPQPRQHCCSCGECPDLIVRKVVTEYTPELDEDMIIEWVVDPYRDEDENGDVPFFVGPASDGWRYDYARSQYCAARAKQIHEQTKMGGGA